MFHEHDAAYLLENITILRENHAFWNRCVAFLTLERNFEELNSAEENWKECKCDMQDPFIRNLHGIEPEFKSTLNTFTDQVVAVVSNVLQPVRERGGLHKVERNAEKAVRQGKNLLWPVKPTDLLPYGPESSVRLILLHECD